jgi:hypothetical protein
VPVLSEMGRARSTPSSTSRMHLQAGKAGISPTGPSFALHTLWHSPRQVISFRKSSSAWVTRLSRRIFGPLRRTAWALSYYSALPKVQTTTEKEDSTSWQHSRSLSLEWSFWQASMPLRIKVWRTLPASLWHRELISPLCWCIHGKTLERLCKPTAMLIVIQAQQQRLVGIFKGSKDRLFGRLGQSCRSHFRSHLQSRVRTVILAYLSGDELVQWRFHRRGSRYELLDETRECKEE